MTDSKNRSALPAIAVIGMSGIFPGAHNVEEFWQNLRDGVESISRFTDAELELNGDSALARDSRYVKSKAILDGVELFDASFFGYTPREAELADPQQRLFLQCAWSALENAGYDTQRFDGSIGVFGGVSFSHYLFANLLSNRDLIDSSGFLQTSIRNRTDHLTTNVAYKLNLRGPAVTVQTACSTSLVAVHLAAQSLINYECDMALAGGSSISLPQKTGYMYQEGGILSPDGHCRAFDAKAQGTVSGNGVGIVVLKRLEDALADRDHIEAVILGSAIGNDGSGKVGYTAPSIEGQAQVIAEAQLVAGVDPDTISYIEAHGTGTKMGDPIEVAALNQVFKAKTNKKGFCAIGALKSNIGHLDTAAGVAGFIKTVLSLKHQTLPPSLHFEQPNPEIDFANSPFFVNAQVRDWESQGPRRAGVSSFGIGGTNAHIVMEEAPAIESGNATRNYQLLLLSARTSTALESATANLAAHLESQKDLKLADVAYTLQTGRREFNHRRAVVCRNYDDAIQALRTLDPHRATTGFYEPKQRPVVFMFPGQGAQYVNMAKGLYESEPFFKAQVDECSRLLKPHLEFDLREVLYPAKESDVAASTKRLTQTEVTQPALFVIEYALARLWMEWGIKPDSMIGHSIGEYVAACISGVFSLEDALALVAARGRLMQSLPTGGMLVVPLTEQEVLPLLKNGLSLAALNGPAFCVVSGPDELIQQLDSELTAKNVASRRLSTSHAFHSAMMDPILDQFRKICQKVHFHAPQLPYLSNLSGTWITEAQVTSPDYWVRHLRETVRFADGIRELVKDPDRVLLEVGPGRTLGTLARWNPYRATGQVVLNSVRHPGDSFADEAYLLTTLGKLWLAGVEVDWSGFYKQEQRKRVALPAYPFETQRYWIEPQKHAEGASAVAKPHKRPNVADWFYTPSWKRAPLVHTALSAEGTVPWLVFCDQYGVGTRLAVQLQAQGIEVFTVVEGTQYGRNSQQFTIRLQSSEDYLGVLNALKEDGKLPAKIVHLWNLVNASVAESLETSFYSPLYLAQAIGALGNTPNIDLLLVSNHLYDVTGNMVMNPQRATLIGPCRVIPQEYPNISCRHIDLDLQPGHAAEAQLLSRVISEVVSGTTDKIVAYRNGHRWVQVFEPLHVQAAPETLPVRQKGTYLITGGVGGIGLVIAEQLAENAQAKLVLVGRSEFPEREKWEEWLEVHDVADPISAKIRKLESLENIGAEVLVLSADVSNEQQMRAAIATAQKRFGTIHGVVHTAGIAGGGIIQLKTAEMADKVLAPKVKGTLVLASIFRDAPLDFFVACSSRSSILGGFGQVDYCAANAFLDVFASYSHSTGATPMISVDWDAWQDVGMLVNKAAEAGIGNSEAPKQQTGHPLLGMVSVESPEKEIYTNTFSPLTHWVLDEHRIVGNAIIPGVAYLEMARAATEKFSSGQTVEIRDAFFLAPLGLRDDEKRDVKIIVEKDGKAYAFRVISRPAEEAGGQEWQEYATGKVAFVPPSPIKKHDIQAIIERCNLRHVVLTDDSKRDEDLGPRWQALKRAYVGENELLSYLELPEQFSPELEKLKLHPSLLDRATGTGKEFLIREGVYLPMGYRRLRMDRPLERKIYVHIRFRANEDTKRQTITFDIVFMDEHGEQLLEIEAFSQKRINDITGQIKVIANRQYRRNEENQAKAAAAGKNGLAGAYSEELQHGITSREGKEAFRHVLAWRQPQIVVSTKDLQASMNEAKNSKPMASILEKAASSDSTQPKHARPELQTAYIEAANEFEKKIASVWQRVLGIKEVGVHDNFFDLGGDSVQAIQIVAQINQLGFQLTPQQLFQKQTIAELAEIAASSQSIHAEQGTVTGEVQLTPIQSRFFEQGHPVPQHYNQSVMLEVPATLDAGLLQRTFHALMKHHDSLRTRFEHTGTDLRQHTVAPEESVPFSEFDFSKTSGAERGQKLDAAIAELQASLDMERGPVFRVAFFRFGPAEPARLLIIAHALVADGLSLRIVLEDLQTAYQQLAEGKEVQLPRKTTSYQYWAKQLRERANSSQVEEERSYWLDPARSEVMELPVDIAGKENTVESTAAFSISLEAQETGSILQEIPKIYHAQVNEVLLTALTQTLNRWAAADRLLVDVEGHGREEALFADVSLTRTVGMLATMSPVLLQLEPDAAPGDALKSIKEQVRRVPNNGIGYGLLRYAGQDSSTSAKLKAMPQPSVRFNYLGQFDQPLKSNAVFTPVREHVAHGHDLKAQRSHLFEITALIFEGKLHIDWGYSKMFFRAQTIENLANEFIENLRKLIDAARASESTEFTPSDFPLASLDDKHLQELEYALEITDHNGVSGKNGHGTLAKIENVLRQHPAVSDVLVTDHAAYVVLKPEHRKAAKKSMEFGLFYFADSNADSTQGKYRLYLEGAKFADRHGFSSVWTPERHFHQKGGLYPNPSVLSSALAVATEKIQLRAGSVVMPLHNPLRVAEEWSIVDNLSRGRVGISFVSGWVPNDFAFFPDRYANKREEMFKGISEVQKLWRGEKMLTRDGAGKMADIGIFPKPIQPELPIWLTCSGSPEMFVQAGELGFNVLTSLQTQPIDEVAVKLKAYREARAKAGHDPETGHVSMMMHTFIGQNKDKVLQKVRGPLSDFLRSHVDLIKTFTKSLEIEAGLDQKELVDSVVGFAVERYYRTASLIGTPQSCVPMIERLKSIGVNEVACLIDFGVDVESTLESLVHLDALKQLCQSSSGASGQDNVEATLTTFLQQKVPSSALPRLAVVESLPAREEEIFQTKTA
ncbi:MAG TPA: MupA/Atu3671 family FMN-dependent luciferase-like monooxygenase [Candidatus Angelobacter sp.]|jgi:natural product biosynthesis luciferase-like monooxygenase protein/non-ribosomal peptide synthase protein (TIGR01720 family)